MPTGCATGAAYPFDISHRGDASLALASKPCRQRAPQRSAARSESRRCEIPDRDGDAYVLRNIVFRLRQRGGTSPLCLGTLGHPTRRADGDVAQRRYSVDEASAGLRRIADMLARRPNSAPILPV